MCTDTDHDLGEYVLRRSGYVCCIVFSGQPPLATSVQIASQSEEGPVSGDFYYVITDLLL
jgi:hypothetical protein